MKENKRVEIIKVIRTDLTIKGDGKEPNNPIRRVIQYWSLDGELLFEIEKDIEPN